MGDVVVSIGDGTTPAKLGAAEETADEEAIKEDNAAVVGALETSSTVLETSAEGFVEQPLQKGARFWLRPWHVNWLRILVWISVASQAQARRAGDEGGRSEVGRSSGQQEARPQGQVALESKGRLEERIALTTLGKTVARNMSLSKQEIPHAAVMDEFDVSELVKFRRTPRDWRKRRESNSLSCPL